MNKYHVVFEVSVWADSKEQAQDFAEKMVADREYSEVGVELDDEDPNDPPGWEGGFAENH